MVKDKSDLVTSYRRWKSNYETAPAAEKSTVLDDVLSGLCEKYPSHDDSAKVFTKVLIIGRTFLTNMEKHLRPLKTETGSEDSVHYLADLLAKRHEKVDAIVGYLKGIKFSWNDDVRDELIKGLAQLHSLTKPARKISKKSGNHFRMTSFVSKYMHFHVRHVPIYDGRAREEARKLCRSLGIRKRQPKPTSKLPDYERFLGDLFEIGKIISGGLAKNEKLTVRDLDLYLYLSNRAAK